MEAFASMLYIQVTHSLRQLRRPTRDILSVSCPQLVAALSSAARVLSGSALAGVQSYPAQLSYKPNFPCMTYSSSLRMRALGLQLARLRRTQHDQCARSLILSASRHHAPPSSSHLKHLKLHRNACASLRDAAASWTAHTRQFSALQIAEIGPSNTALRAVLPARYFEIYQAGEYDSKPHRLRLEGRSFDQDAVTLEQPSSYLR